MSDTMEAITTATPCRQCARKCDPDKHYGYCLGCIRNLARQHRCRSCPADTFNASRFCVACIRCEEAKVAA